MTKAATQQNKPRAERPPYTKIAKEALMDAERVTSEAHADTDKLTRRAQQINNNSRNLWESFASLPKNKTHMGKKDTEKKKAGRNPSRKVIAHAYPDFLIEENGVRKLRKADDILRDGSLIERVFLFISNDDKEGYFREKDTTLTREQKTKLWGSIKNHKEEIKIYFAEYMALKEYGKTLRHFFKVFQVDFSVLARLLNLWDRYEQEARTHTRILNDFFNLASRWGITLYEQGEKFFQLENEEPQEGAREQGTQFAQMACNTYVAKVMSSAKEEKWEGACLRYNYEDLEFYVDVEPSEEEETEVVKSPSLYEQITMYTAMVKRSLSDFKAYMVVVEEFWRNEAKLGYLPISIQNYREGTLEMYENCLVKNLAFYRKDLNERRRKGEAITADDERKAVIPDYDEITPSKDIMEDCSEGLKNYLETELEKFK